MDQLDQVQVAHLGHPKWTKRLTRMDHLGDVQGVAAGAHLVVSRRTGRASLPDEVGSSPQDISRKGRWMLRTNLVLAHRSEPKMSRNTHALAVPDNAQITLPRYSGLRKESSADPQEKGCV